MALEEGKTGMWNGQRVIVRGGKIVPLTPPKLTAQEEGDLVDLRKASRVMSTVADQANQFVDLNRKSGTGIGRFGWLGDIAATFDPNVKGMQALTAQMAPQQRVPGSGTTSDRDLALFMQAVPSLTNSGQANADIAARMRGMSAKQNALAAFADDYAMRKGTLKGVDEAFQRDWAARQSKKGSGKPSSPMAAKRPPLADIFK